MNYPVIWLPEAEVTFKQNLQYLNNKWTSDVKTDFLNRVDKAIRLASANPNVYPIYRKRGQIRKCVIHQRIALYFKVKNETIY